MNVWWAAGGAVVFVVGVIGTLVRRGRRRDLTLPPVSDQWLAHQKRDRYY